MKKLYIFMLMFITRFVQANDQLLLGSAQNLHHFVAAQEHNLLSTDEALVQIFSDSFMSYDMLRKVIRCDITHCKRAMRQSTQNNVLYKPILKQLRSLYNYVKKHKECCKAIYFHEELRQRYQAAFNNPNIVQCVERTPFLYGVGECKYRCRAYFSKISADLRKICKFEDTLHGDFGALKARNYVYKIELIKVRNYIYHHNIYKYETRYF